MSINSTLVEKIKEDMIEDVIKKKNIVNIEKYLYEHVRTMDAVDLAKKYRCSLVDAIETIELLKKPAEINKIVMTLG